MTRIAFKVFATLTAVAALCSAFFYAKVREREVVMEYFTRDATRGIPATDTTAIALAISRDVYRRTNRSIVPGDLPLYERLESTSFFNVTSTVSLLRGTYGILGHTTIGPCGTMSRAVLGSLWSLGIPARKLQLLPVPNRPGGGHTMVEFFEGGRWRVLSPSDSTFTWLTRDGQIATVEEIRADTALFAQIFRRFPNYPYRFDNTAHIRWSKFPPPVQRAMRVLLGERGFRSALTPALYDQPRRLLWYMAMACCACFGALALLARSRRAPPSARGDANPPDPKLENTGAGQRPVAVRATGPGGGRLARQRMPAAPTVAR